MTTAAEKPGTLMGRPLKEYTPENYRERWALNFRRLRRKRFDNQAEFCQQLNHCGVDVKPGTVSHWERGFRIPTILEIPGIAAALGVNVGRLFPPNDNSPADRD